MRLLLFTDTAITDVQHTTQIENGKPVDSAVVSYLNNLQHYYFEEEVSPSPSDSEELSTKTNFSDGSSLP